MTKFFNKKDPFYNREKNKYTNPICSREHILSYIAHCGGAVSHEHLLKGLDIKEDIAIDAMNRRLRAMYLDGQVDRNKQKEWVLPDSTNLLSGYIQAARDGFGFLICDNGADDIYISPRQMRQVFNEDRVLVRQQPRRRGQRTEGIIVEILERKTRFLVGRYVEESGIAFVDPFNSKVNHDILIAKGKSSGAKLGDYVEVQIIEQPTIKSQAVAEVVRVLGDHLTPGLEVMLSMCSHDIPSNWSQDVKRSLAGIPNSLRRSDYRGRANYLSLPFVTIDGEDAKDFDDAIFCRSTDKGWHLYVAIADVGHYIKKNSPLDIAAKERGNSVYFPGQVVPMLPEVLSDGLCSLLPKVDRLVFAVDMLIDHNGSITRSSYKKAVIHSQARLTYDEVNNYLNKQVEMPEDLLHLKSHLHTAYNCFRALKKARNRRGAIDFDGVETKIIFDQVGKIKTIIPTVRHDIHRMIEEFMLAANVSVARFLAKNKVNTLYREHQAPDASKFKALREFLHALGLRLPSKVSSPKAYANLLKRIDGRADSHLIQMVMLRSLSQATYTPISEGHFGLAYDDYCQFTSPIRRYPDLIVHRCLDSFLRNKKKDCYTADYLTSLGESCSHTERRADMATRDARDWLKCHYVQDKVGESYDGVITQVTSFGFFVELIDFFIEGLCHISKLPDDYYQFDSVNHTLSGKKKSHRFCLGDSVRVTLIHVNLDRRQVDFSLDAGERCVKQRRKRSREDKISLAKKKSRSIGNKKNSHSPGKGKALSRQKSTKKNVQVKSSVKNRKWVGNKKRKESRN